MFGRRDNAKLLKKRETIFKLNLISFDKVTFSSRDTPTKEILLLTILVN